MIEFVSEIEFELDDELEISKWISKAISSEGFEEGEIMYIFCDDLFLLKLNEQYLKHDTLTDIISFDYTVGNQINGEMYISIERVRENAVLFEVPFRSELLRVLIHGILHYCGYKDKTDVEEMAMRSKEDGYLRRI